MAAIALADDPIPPNRFSGTVTLNGAPAPNDTVINAFIDGNPRGSIVVESPGEYEYLCVNGSASDDGKTVTFKVCGATAEQTGTWTPWIEEVQILDLTAVDDEAPAVTNANATPSSIVADGVETTQLSATVIDGCGVDTVTVDLSDIGGDAAQAMSCVGTTDVYSVTVTAAEGTAGAHCLYVNASDVFGKCNTSVCIALEVTAAGLPQTGDMDGNGDVDFGDAVYLARHVIFGEALYPLHADGNVDSINDVDFGDAVYLARHVIFGETLYPLYP
jgi:hypothetical protein